MTLTGAQTKQIQAALLSAFGKAELARMVQFHLDETLAQIADGDNDTQIVFNLVQWADRNGRVPDLIDGALVANPELQDLQQEASNWRMEPPEEGEPPYQGLQYFNVGDADRFFGRERLTAELVGYLRQHCFLAVIGASGSGKSSVVRAGVVPALASDEKLADGSLPPKDSADWLVRILTPTARPLKALSASLTRGSESVTAQATLMDDMTKDARSLDLFASRMLADSPADHLLLVVDQFEELFTLCKDPAERRAFVDNLLTAAQPDGVMTVIITLRADFYHRCAKFDDLRTALEGYQKYIGAMSKDELCDAIEKPATLGGWDFEPRLVDVMLHDVEHEPGALPLLSHALLETWNNRRGRTMTFAGYYEAGGVKGAIATRADAEFSHLTPDEQVVARNIFIRLTELGEGSVDTRRRVEREELLSAGKDAETVTKVLTTLGYARLITVDQDEVEVAHEALIREWPTLRGWLEDDREGLRIHRRLTETAEEWDESGRRSGDLFRGTRLDQTLEWAEINDDALNDLERQFLAVSREQVEAEKREKERIEREREESLERELKAAHQAHRRSQIAALAASLAVLVLVGFLGYLGWQRYQARGERALAEAFALQDQIQNSTDGEEISELTEAAKKKIELAIDADPSLGNRIGVTTFVTDTLRIGATQLVHEGERLAAEADRTGAHAQFEQAFALNTLFDDYAVPPEAPLYVWIEEGEFMMGSGNADRLADYDEKPLHAVLLDGYWIMRTEVTNEQYRQCVEKGPCDDKKLLVSNPVYRRDELANRPITNVSWHDAMTYARWVGGMLPTEAQWEMACRGTDGHIYPWSDAPPSPDLLNYGASNINGTTDVGSYPTGANGLYDMAGNVWEWTTDWYDSEYYGDSAERHPQGPESGSTRTLRGGSWVNGDSGVRCARRYLGFPNSRNSDVGFRVVFPGL